MCELKAAQTGMWLIRRYVADKESGDALLALLRPYEAFLHEAQGAPDTLFREGQFTRKILPKNGSAYGQDLADRMVLLIKEELHHFSQVLEIMQARGIPYRKITASRYAKGMIREIRTHDPATLIDKLICGAYIEARSCERFAKLAPHGRRAEPLLRLAAAIRSAPLSGLPDAGGTDRRRRHQRTGGAFRPPRS